MKGGKCSLPIKDNNVESLGSVSIDMQDLSKYTMLMILTFLSHDRQNHTINKPVKAVALITRFLSYVNIVAKCYCLPCN